MHQILFLSWISISTQKECGVCADVSVLSSVSGMCTQNCQKQSSLIDCKRWHSAYSTNNFLMLPGSSPACKERSKNFTGFSPRFSFSYPDVLSVCSSFSLFIFSLHGSDRVLCNIQTSVSSYSTGWCRLNCVGIQGNV